MLYRADHTVNTAGHYVEPFTRSRLPCRSAREMQALYPNGDYLIVGEIGVVTLMAADGDLLLAGDGTEVPICPRGSLTRPFEWVSGYIPMGGDVYAAATASIFPIVFRRWAKAAKSRNMHSSPQGGYKE